MGQLFFIMSASLCIVGGKEKLEIRDARNFYWVLETHEEAKVGSLIGL